MTSILTGEQLRVTFHARGHQVTALDGVDFRLQAGQRLGLVGGSGSGKSTLARTLMGLQVPDAGEILFDGRPVASKADWRRLRQDVSMVFQDPNSSLNPRMKLDRIITEPLGRKDPNAAEAAMTDVALNPRLLTRYPHQLSGGQRQRVAIARALVTQPRVLIADEPVSALDVSVRAQVLSLLRRAVENRDLALLFVSHDLAVVEHLCDDVMVMQRGKIVESGPCKKVLKHPQHSYTKALVDASFRL